MPFSKSILISAVESHSPMQKNIIAFRWEKVYKFANKWRFPSFFKSRQKLKVSSVLKFLSNRMALIPILLLDEKKSGFLQINCVFPHVFNISSNGNSQKSHPYSNCFQIAWLSSVFSYLMRNDNTAEVFSKYMTNVAFS